MPDDAFLAYLRTLCDPKASRPPCQAPWRLDALRVGATDGVGMAVLHAPDLDVGQDAPAAPGVDRALAGAVTVTGHTTLGALRAWAGPIPDPVTCPHCAGTGKVECETCDGTGEHACGDCDVVHDCGTCGSGPQDCRECIDGKIPVKPLPIRVGDAAVDRHRVARLAAVPWPDDTDLRVETRGPEDAVTFSAPGGVLAAAPLRGQTLDCEALPIAVQGGEHDPR